LPTGTATAPAATAPAVTGSAHRGLSMPTRKTSRIQDRTRRLRAERKRNQQAIDEDPPPF
jgi:hypothetical protein